MARTLNEILPEVEKLRKDIIGLLVKADYMSYDDLSGIEYDKTDPEQLFLIDKLCQVFYDLDNACSTLNHLSRTIKTEGILRKKSNGRYELNGSELTSGNGIEYLATDDRHHVYDNSGSYQQVAYWRSSRIEHNGADYYIVGDSDIKLDGLRARIR